MAIGYLRNCTTYFVATAAGVVVFIVFTDIRKQFEKKLLRFMDQKNTSFTPKYFLRKKAL